MTKSLVLLENVFVLDNWMTFFYELVVILTIATNYVLTSNRTDLSALV